MAEGESVQHGDFFSRTPSVAAGRRAVVTTSNPAAAQAAIRIAEAGGNAADMAVATSFALSVVEPMSLGPGGDAIVAIWPPNSPEPLLYNGCGRLPLAFDPSAVGADRDGGIPIASAHSVTIPGAIDAWCRLAEDHGRLTLRQLVQPAIELAHGGFVVQPRTAFDWQRRLGNIQASPETAKRFGVGGDAPQAGTTHRFPELAETFDRIGRHGQSAFYTGALAAEMTGTLRRAGGHHQMADFERHRGRYLRASSARFGEDTAFTMAGNTPGHLLLALLALDEDSHHAIGHVMSTDRLLFDAIANKLLAERRFDFLSWAEQPQDQVFMAPEWLKDAAHERWRRGAPLPPLCPTKESLGDTASVLTADHEGGIVSVTSSLFSNFGSGIYCSSTGVLFNNRGHAFRSLYDPPYAARAGRLAPHTLVAAAIQLQAGSRLVSAMVGGAFQPLGLARLICARTRAHQSLSEALSTPRAWIPDGTRGDWRLEAEPTANNTALRSESERRGIQYRHAAEPIGSGQMLEQTTEGTFIAAADSRRDGCALAL